MAAKYKHTQKGNPRIFDILTVDDNGQIILEFHGLDRTVTYTGAQFKDTDHGRVVTYSDGNILPMYSKDGTLRDGWTEL